MSKSFSKIWDILAICFITVMTILLGLLGSLSWLFNSYDKKVFKDNEAK